MLVAGTVALDSIHTSTAQHDDLLGGSASYAALAAAFCGPVQLCGIVGKDFPQENVELFRDRKIGMSCLDVVEGKTFRWTGRYHDDMNHRETLSVSIDVLELFDPKLTPEVAASPVLLLANMSPENQLAVVNQMTARPFVVLDSMDLWINIAREKLMEIMGHADLFVINEDEAKLFTECSNLVVAGKKLLAMGPRNVVVKKGEHGAMLFGPDRFFASVAWPLETVADPTGAGDSFAGGLAGHLATLGKSAAGITFTDLAEAMVRGTVTASFTCEEFGVKRLARATAAEINSRIDAFRACTQLTA